MQTTKRQTRKDTKMRRFTEKEEYVALENTIYRKKKKKNPPKKKVPWRIKITVRQHYGMGNEPKTMPMARLLYSYL